MCCRSMSKHIKHSLIHYIRKRSFFFFYLPHFRWKEGRSLTFPDEKINSAVLMVFETFKNIGFQIFIKLKSENMFLSYHVNAPFKRSIFWHRKCPVQGHCHMICLFNKTCAGNNMSDSQLNLPVHLQLGNSAVCFQGPTWFEACSVLKKAHFPCLSELTLE